MSRGRRRAQAGHPRRTPKAATRTPAPAPEAAPELDVAAILERAGDSEDIRALATEIARLRANATYAKANLTKLLWAAPFYADKPTSVAVSNGVGPSCQSYTVPYALFEGVVCALIDGQKLPDGPDEWRPVFDHALWLADMRWGARQP